MTGSDRERWIVRFRVSEELPRDIKILFQFLGYAFLDDIENVLFDEDGLAGSVIVIAPSHADPSVVREKWELWQQSVRSDLERLVQNKARLTGRPGPSTSVALAGSPHDYLPIFTEIQQPVNIRAITTEERPVTESSAANATGIAKVVAEIRDALPAVRSDTDGDALLDRAVEMHVTSEHTSEKQLARSLGRLALIDGNMKRLKRDLDTAVHEARDRGANWSEIGRALGIRPESAMRRWDPVAREKHNTYQRNRGRGEQENP